MRRIIFLDIDGVLASYSFLASRTPEDYETPGRGFVEPAKVQLLNQLKGAEVVISSSWGYDNGNTERALIANGLELPIVGYTRRLTHQFDWACRGNEIEDWIISNVSNFASTKFGHDEEGFSYVIFDDDSDFLLGQRFHLIITNGHEALTQEHIDEAKCILNL